MQMAPAAATAAALGARAARSWDRCATFDGVVSISCSSVIKDVISPRAYFLLQIEREEGGRGRMQETYNNHIIYVPYFDMLSVVGTRFRESHLLQICN